MRTNAYKCIYIHKHTYILTHMNLSKNTYRMHEGVFQNFLLFFFAFWSDTFQDLTDADQVHHPNAALETQYPVSLYQAAFLWISLIQQNMLHQEENKCAKWNTQITASKPSH